MKFLIMFDDDKLTPFYRSAPIPEKNDGPVTIIVADEYEKIITNSPDDLFIMYIIDWAKDCVKYQPIFEDLANELKDVPNLVFGLYDLTDNDPKTETVTKFPDFILHEASTKKEKDFTFNEEITVENFKNFLLEKSTAY